MCNFDIGWAMAIWGLGFCTGAVIMAFVFAWFDR